MSAHDRLAVRSLVISIGECLAASPDVRAALRSDRAARSQLWHDVRNVRAKAPTGAAVDTADVVQRAWQRRSSVNTAARAAVRSCLPPGVSALLDDRPGSGLRSKCIPALLLLQGDVLSLCLHLRALERGEVVVLDRQTGEHA